MQCAHPVRIQMSNKTGYASWRYPEGLTVPCGKCLLCRIQKRKEWSIRMLHELEAHNDSCFITLTYSDDTIPDTHSLVKSHLQNFFKRLRKNLDGRRIKYFACGEYGGPPKLLPNGYFTDGYRPHYHAILFGIGLKEKQYVIDSWPLSDWSVPKIRNRSFGLAEPDSIRYVAQYIDKKYSGEKEIEEYYSKFRNPVFRLCSVGLGSNYCDRFGTQFAENGYLTLNGVKHSIPRYYLKRLKLNADDINSIKAYEKECDVLHKHIGLDMSYDEAYKYLRADEVLKYEEAIKNAKAQNVATILKKASLYEPKL